MSRRGKEDVGIESRGSGRGVDGVDWEKRENKGSRGCTKRVEGVDGE